MLSVMGGREVKPSACTLHRGRRQSARICNFLTGHEASCSRGTWTTSRLSSIISARTDEADEARMSKIRRGRGTY